MKNMKPFFMNTIKSSNNFFAEYMDKVLIELMHKAIKDLDLYNHLGEKEKDIYDNRNNSGCDYRGRCGGYCICQPPAVWETAAGRTAGANQKVASLQGRAVP